MRTCYVCKSKIPNHCHYLLDKKRDKKEISRKELVLLFPYDTNREKIELLLKGFGVKIKKEGGPGE